MLVLTRKQGERIQIGDDVIITVVRTKGKAVRLGIQAPAHVPVLRGEILRSIESESQRQAAETHDEYAGDDDEPAGALASTVVAATLPATTPNRSRAVLRDFLDARAAQAAACR